MILFESVLIVHFLDHVDGRSFMPRDPVGYWEAQRWQALGNGIIDAAIQRIFETRRPPEHQLQDKMEREAGRVRRAIALASGAPGNANVVTLALKNRSRAASGWHDTQRLEHSGPDGAAIRRQSVTKIDIPGLTLEELKALEKALIKSGMVGDHPK